MTPQQKFEFIQRQCYAIWDSGTPQDITCPYCAHIVLANEGPCCDLVDKAIRAIIERAKTVETMLESYKRDSFENMIMGSDLVN